MAGKKPTGLYRPADGSLMAGRYKIMDPEPIGEGGMGTVWRGFDIRLKTSVAIKILHPQFEGMSEVVARFHRETDAVNRIGHEGIVVIHDRAAPDETPVFIVMEFLDGKTLAQVLDDNGNGKPLHLQHIRYIGLKILEPLAAAHAVGVVHRDLKPENIFVIGPLHRRYRVKILDFGIAKFMEADAHLTQHGIVMGTPLYMSPEQVQGLPVDHRTDLYAVGCLLYEMATGRPPFVGELEDVQRGHMHGMPEAPIDLNKEIPPALDLVIRTALAKDPNRRFPDAEAMLIALEDAIPEDKMFWRDSRPPSPVNGRVVGTREPRLLPREVSTTPPDPDDSKPTRLVPEAAAAARSLEGGDIGRAKTILTPTNGTILGEHGGWISRIPRGARWSLLVLLVLVVATVLVALALPSRSTSKETDATDTATDTMDTPADVTAETTAETTKRDVVYVPVPVFMPAPTSRDAEAEMSEDAADTSEADATDSTPEADAGEDVAEVEPTEAEDATPPAEYATHLALGKAAAEAENWRVAADEFRAARDAWPDGADARRGLGNALLALGEAAEKAENWRVAADEFRAATEAWPEGAKAWRGLGNALLSLFLREEGEDAIRQYLELEPNAADAPYFRSLIGVE